jgi:two-component system KDP operon response regulator KdpE
MKKAVVLIVEKDRSSSAGAVEALREAGYEVVEAAGAADGLKMIYETHPDVVIASTDLPSVNGEDACLRLRQASYLPLIAIGRREEVVEMLELGVDACIISPPSGREVVARVNSLLKRKEDDDPPGGAGVGIESHLRPEAGTEGLSPVECRLGKCLLSNEGRLLDYPRLITEVWGGKDISLDNLHYYVRRLRRKLSGFKIFGVRGVGYGVTEASRTT